MLSTDGARLRALVAQLEETAAHYEEQADNAMFARRLQRAGRAAAGKPEIPDDECEAVTIRLACDSLLNINEVAPLVQLLRDAKAELDALLSAPPQEPK